MKLSKIINRGKLYNFLWGKPKINWVKPGDLININYRDYIGSGEVVVSIKENNCLEIENSITSLRGGKLKTFAHEFCSLEK